MPSPTADNPKGHRPEDHAVLPQGRELTSDLASALAHLDQIRTAIKAFHSARGRHNSQVAAARMFELVGLPAEFPKEKSGE